MKLVEVATPGFTCVAGSVPGATCVLCRGQGKVMLCQKDEADLHHPLGICEPCSNLAHWAWRQVAGEVLGSPAETVASRIYVVLARRRRVPGAEPGIEHAVAAPPELCSSWEFMLVEQPDGSLDLPSASGLRAEAEGIPATALCALADIGLASWPSLMEPLYSSYTPRGHLVHVVLARGWTARIARSDVFWHAWPISVHAGNMAEFWRGMETVWPLRLYKHCAEGVTEELCVQLREAACRFVELQEAAREGREVDTTMLAALQAGMSADEVAVARMIQRAAEKPEDEGRSQSRRRPLGKGKRSKKEATPGSVPRDEPEGGEVPGEDEAAPKLASDDIENTEEQYFQEVEGGEDGLDDSTFARPKR